MYMFDDPTEIYANRKQEQLDSIREVIQNHLLHGTEVDVYEDSLEYISAKEVGKYLNMIVNSKSLKVKLPKLTPLRIENPVHIQEVFDMTNNTPEEKFPNYVEVFVLETCDFAITVIPIEANEKVTTIHMTALENCPDFLTTAWAEKIDKKTDISQIDFVNPSDLRSQGARR